MYGKIALFCLGQVYVRKLLELKIPTLKTYAIKHMVSSAKISKSQIKKVLSPTCSFKYFYSDYFAIAFSSFPKKHIL